MPYISLIPKENCQQENCPGPYSFQHQMKLAADAELFKERVKNAPISGNIDNPEGGFDALVQVRQEYLYYSFRLVFIVKLHLTCKCDGRHVSTF